MTEHIELTIRDITAHITRLNDVVAYLHELAVVDPTAMPLKTIRRSAPDGSAPAAPRRFDEKQFRGGADRIIATARTLQEPFSTVQLHRAASIPKSSAGSTITRWLNRGWIKRVGLGAYIRTASFANNGAKSAPAPKKRSPLAQAVLDEASRVAIPGLDEDRSGVEEKLEKALKDRDDALAKGQDRLAKILQDKVDKLQGELIAAK